MPTWAPETWDDFGVVGIILFIAAAATLALLRGWIVLGTHHKEIVDGYKRAEEKADARAVKDADTINDLSKAITEKNATEAATTRILEALRQTVGDR